MAAVYLALGPRATRRLIAFTTAAFVVTFAGGVIVALGLGDLILGLLPKLSRSVKYEVLTLLGIGLMVGGAVIWWHRASLAGGKPSDRTSDHTTPPAGASAWLAGAGIAGIEFLTAFPYFAAIAMIIGSSEPAPAKLSLLLIYNVIYVLPLIAITVVSVVMGDRAGKVLTPLGDWVATRWPVVVAPLAFVAGLVLAVYSVLQLT